MLRIGDLVRQIDHQATFGSHDGYVFTGPVGIVTAIEVGYEDDRDELRSVDVLWDGADASGGYESTITHEPKGENPITISDIEPVTPELWVNVYLRDRAFGGPEEGGWWFDCGAHVPEESRWYSTPEAARAAFDAKRLWCDEANCHRNSDLGSVCCEGRYSVSLESWPGESWPAMRPHYC